MGPDFLIIGAMKCGTSTLQAQLALQTGVFMTTPKEPNYFSDNDVYAQGPDWYADLFAHAGPDDLKGEASTHYTKLPTYPDTLARMQAALESPKLIYMIRNPLDRAVSHYLHAWSMGEAGHDPVSAFETMPELVSYGCYGSQIAPFMDAYGAQNILLTSLEQFKQDPDTAFAEVVQFLDLPPGTAWQHDLPAQNVSAQRVRRLPLQGLLVDNPIARGLRRTLVPKSVRTWIRQARSPQQRPELAQEQKQALMARFLEDRAVLAQHFPHRPAVDLCYPFKDAT